MSLFVMRLLKRISIGSAVRLAAYALPNRIVIIVVSMACLVAILTYSVSMAFAFLGWPWMAAKAQQYATTFEAMPLWLSIGMGMHRVAARLDELIRNVEVEGNV